MITHLAAAVLLAAGLCQQPVGLPAQLADICRIGLDQFQHDAELDLAATDRIEHARVILDRGGNFTVELYYLGPDGVPYAGLFKTSNRRYDKGTYKGTFYPHLVEAASYRLCKAIRGNSDLACPPVTPITLERSFLERVARDDADIPIEFRQLDGPARRNTPESDRTTLVQALADGQANRSPRHRSLRALPIATGDRYVGTVQLWWSTGGLMQFPSYERSLTTSGRDHLRRARKPLTRNNLQRFANSLRDRHDANPHRNIYRQFSNMAALDFLLANNDRAGNFIIDEDHDFLQMIDHDDSFAAADKKVFNRKVWDAVDAYDPQLIAGIRAYFDTHSTDEIARTIFAGLSDRRANQYARELVSRYRALDASIASKQPF